MNSCGLYPWLLCLPASGWVQPLGPLGGGRKWGAELGFSIYSRVFALDWMWLQHRVTAFLQVAVSMWVSTLNSNDYYFLSSLYFFLFFLNFILFLNFTRMHAYSVASNFLWSNRLQPTRPLCPWDSPDKNIGPGCHFLLQGIFPTQGSNSHLCLLHKWADSLPLSHLGSPNLLLECTKHPLALTSICAPAHNFIKSLLIQLPSNSPVHVTMSWDPKCPPSGAPNDILFYFSCPLFYWRIVDVQYYTSYRYATKWVTIFKGYIPFLIKYQLCSLYCTKSPWNLFMLDYFSFNRLHWAHMVSQTTCWPPCEPKSTQPCNSKDGPHTPGRGCKERIQPPGKTGPESSFHTERLMSYAFAVSFKGISIPQFSKRNKGNCVLGFLHRVLRKI